ncbi:MAG: DUF1571 domain-containing protein [Planctomycetes bacterium]|nr:DUF1571 domain-containing protein [Planctomycetota bacterium]
MGKGKRKRVKWGWLAVVTGMLMASAPGRAQAAPDPMKLLYECKAACNKVKDFTAVFSKQEQMNGELRPKETVEMKFRYKPFSVYMIWQNPHKGREVIYHEGKYENDVVGHQRVGFLNFSKRTAPKSAEALKLSRRPITQAGFHNAIRLIVEKTELGKKNNEILISYLGEEVWNNRPVHVICRMFTKQRPEYPVYMGVFYIDKQLMIPVKVVGYDWDHRLIGLYTYTNVKLNVGLTDKDFDISNKKYDFPKDLFPDLRKLWPFGGGNKKK